MKYATLFVVLVMICSAPSTKAEATCQDWGDLTSLINGMVMSQSDKDALLAAMLAVDYYEVSGTDTQLADAMNLYNETLDQIWFANGLTEAQIQALIACWNEANQNSRLLAPCDAWVRGQCNQMLLCSGPSGKCRAWWDPKTGVRTCSNL